MASLLAGQKKRKEKKKSETGTLQALNCLDDLDQAGLIDELAVQLWPRGARFAALHVVPNGLFWLQFVALVFLPMEPSPLLGNEKSSQLSLYFTPPLVVGAWFPVFLFFRSRRTSLPFPRSSRERSRSLFSRLFIFWTNSVFPLLWVPDHGHRLLYSSDTTQSLSEENEKKRPQKRKTKIVF